MPTSTQLAHLPRSSIVELRKTKAWAFVQRSTDRHNASSINSSTWPHSSQIAKAFISLWQALWTVNKLRTR